MFGFMCMLFNVIIFLVWMGVIEIFGVMGKILEFAGILFINWKITSKQTVPDDPFTHFSCCPHNDWYNFFWKPDLPNDSSIHLFWCAVQLRSFTRVWNNHFIILSFRVRDSFPEETFWRQLAIHSPEYHNIMRTKCKD